MTIDPNERRNASGRRGWWGAGTDYWDQQGCLGCGPAWWVIAGIFVFIFFAWGWGWPGWGGWEGWGWRHAAGVTTTTGAPVDGNANGPADQRANPPANQGNATRDAGASSTPR